MQHPSSSNFRLWGISWLRSPPEALAAGTPSTTVRPELVEGLPFFLDQRMAFWAYMLHCNGGAFYVGHTDDLERRIAEHERGALPGFTRDHMPVRLVWNEAFGTREEALAMERRVKGWSRAKKMALIRGDWQRIEHLSRGAREGQGFDKLSPNGG